MINEMLVENIASLPRKECSLERGIGLTDTLYPGILVTRINGFQRNPIVLGQRDACNEKSRRLRNNRDNVNAFGI